MNTKEECKNETAMNNNFDSFKRAIRYTFNRELLESEQIFINKIIDESMDCFAKNEAIEFSDWCANNAHNCDEAKEMGYNIGVGYWLRNTKKVSTNDLYAQFMTERTQTAQK